jgi:hypothetical protein
VNRHIHIQVIHCFIGSPDSNGAIIIASSDSYQRSITVYDHANAAFDHANSSFIKTNSAFSHANSAYESQNATGQYANAAFLRANNSLDANVGGIVTGNISVGGAITPNLDLTWNLGNTEYRWHSLFLGPGSLNVGGLVLSNVNGIATFDGEVSDLTLIKCITSNICKLCHFCKYSF